MNCNSVYRILLLLVGMILPALIGCWTYAQSDPLSTQYMNSQLRLNPAYTGVRNTFSINVLARQQWMGIEGAPATYMASVHSPINKSKASLGAMVMVDQAGPLQSNHFSAFYAYLIRLNHQTFLSAGLSASLYNHSFKTSDIDVVDGGDPSLVAGIQNPFTPNFGVGTFIYSPNFYIGLSVPYILATELKNEEDGQVISQLERHYYLSGGYGVGMGKDFYLKPSFLWRFRSEGDHLLDLNAQMMFKELFWIGGSWRMGHSVAVLANFQVSKNWGICYSYDIPMGNTPSYFQGAHEITLTIDSDRFIRRNKDRRFLKKKVKNEEEGGMRSIRYF